MQETAETLAPLQLIDTAGCDCEEDEEDEPAGRGGGGSAGGGSSGDGGGGGGGGSAGGGLVLHEALSKSNGAEARLVGEHVRALLAAGVKPEEIGVITPYNAQVVTSGSSCYWQES